MQGQRKMQAAAAYLGDDDSFERAITDFAEGYADQNERDYAEIIEQLRSVPGRL